ncbi:putative ATPase (AAA+ superfamily) [Belliella baltica DSM 15883]|uniref:Putative ATPase (AAA+ superfamily) n=1 Tax=Belliella baltica (strain DSM 15883 / CIP 108006 / LMG 21964 / BA134) TaxID=866536 RepID=I3Z545_BELBD|nr:ATP-binding protein [Belliella baltica]AFL84363.1 putative ATPase (AAA+ superfamily) [Belliella baltica DSM 15883]
MAYQRSEKTTLLKRLKDEPRRFIQVIYGPRQVGKTTMVRQISAELDYPHLLVAADAVPAGDGVWIAQQWELARIEQAKQSDKPFLLVIDEVQKIDNWSEQVKSEWDRDASLGIDVRVVLLGSSRLMLQQGLTESLAGRFEATYLGHWSYGEMKAAFGLTAEEFVWLGGYPGAITLKDDEDRWKSYIRDSLLETSISKDILMLTRVDKPALMKRLFELGSVYSGQVLSFTKIMGQLSDAGNTTTLANYVELLNEAGLLGGLEKFSPNMVRKRSSSPKFIVHNTAIMSGISNESFDTLMENPKTWGRWVESAVGAHLVNQSFKDKYLTIHYWRQGNDEVDYVIEYKKKVIALEVKSAKTGKLSGLNAFDKKFKPQKSLLIGSGGIPWQEFLEMDVVSLFK